MPIVRRQQAMFRRCYFQDGDDFRRLPAPRSLLPRLAHSRYARFPAVLFSFYICSAKKTPSLLI